MFRAAVLRMLKKEGKIDDDFIRMLMRWRHVSGFNIHNGQAVENLAERARTDDDPQIKELHARA